MYRLRYYADFKDNDNNSLRLEIYIDSNAAVTSEEIKLLSDAITIEYSAESLFEPLKTSRASISILTEDLMTDLYSGGLFGTAIKILKNNSLFWTGYATPCIYQQSYVGKWDVLTLECVDSVSQLQNIDYTNATNDDSGIASFFNVIAHCLTQVDPLHAVTKLYVDNSITLGNSQPIFDALHIKERNFYDEKNEPETPVAAKPSEEIRQADQFAGDALNVYYLWNRQIADLVIARLVTRGVDASLVVTETNDISLRTRAMRVNRICDQVGTQNVLLVSIHSNAAGNGSSWMNAKGWSCYTTPGKTGSDEFAECFYDAFSRAFPERRMRRDLTDGDSDYEENFYILAKTTWLQLRTTKERIADAIVAGLFIYLSEP